MVLIKLIGLGLSGLLLCFCSAYSAFAYAKNRKYGKLSAICATIFMILIFCFSYM